MPKTTSDVVLRVNNGTATAKERNEFEIVIKFTAQQMLADMIDKLDDTVNIVNNMVQKEKDKTRKLEQLLDRLKDASPEEIEKIFKIIEVMFPDDKEDE